MKEEILSLFQSGIPQDYNVLIILAIFTLLIIVYAIFVFYFYKYLSKKNLVELNLSQYNRYQHAGAAKFTAFIFYILEYIIILPVLTLFWFGTFSLFLLLLSKAEAVLTILTLSAALVSSVRISAYVNEQLAEDLAKMVPLALLAFFILEPDFFQLSLFLDRFSQIPTLLSQIPYYLFFIIALEFVMRIGDLIVKTLSTGTPEDTEEEKQAEGEQE
ncbi:MAG: hypothetical protein ACP5D2_02805 [Candidatus Nanoarchaeia archaeon]